MVGLMDDSTPQAPGPIRNHFRCPESSQPCRKRSLALGSGDGSGGAGGVMGVASVGWVVGWALGPVPAPPPASLPQEFSRARSVLDPGVERWGRGRGRSGHRRASLNPPSLGTPRKKWCRG